MINNNLVELKKESVNIPKLKTLNKLCDAISSLKLHTSPTNFAGADSPTSRNNSVVKERDPLHEQLKEMNDLDNFFSKKLTMKEIDSYLNDNKLQFNFN